MSAQKTQGRLVCINCGNLLTHLQCKVRCQRCGYFEDCSDVGNDHPNVTWDTR